MNQRIVELEKDEKELSDKDKSIDNELNKLEDEKIELVRKLYKIDETYNIDELTNLNCKLLVEKERIEKQKK